METLKTQLAESKQRIEAKAKEIEELKENNKLDLRKQIEIEIRRAMSQQTKMDDIRSMTTYRREFLHPSSTFHSHLLQTGEAEFKSLQSIALKLYNESDLRSSQTITTFLRIARELNSVGALLDSTRSEDPIDPVQEGIH